MQRNTCTKLCTLHTDMHSLTSSHSMRAQYRSHTQPHTHIIHIDTYRYTSLQRSANCYSTSALDCHCETLPLRCCTSLQLTCTATVPCCSTLHYRCALLPLLCTAQPTLLRYPLCCTANAQTHSIKSTNPPTWTATYNVHHRKICT